jgi:glycosyltransferase involved in cell wall biosynthesis
MNSGESPGTSPLVSIVITCFNYARFVAAAIAGALAQTHPRTEIIVVNDGSTDDSLQVIGRYGDRVRIINQPNGGSISALNRGFAQAGGDIVMFLDADDLMAPAAVAEVVRAWHPGCAKAQYDLSIIDAEGRDLGRRFCSFRPGYDAAAVRASFRRTGTYRWPVTAGNAYARWFAAPLFPLAIEHGADGTLNTLAPLYGDVVTIPRTLGSYRLHDANKWAGRGDDVGRMPERIRHRRVEIATLREHAARKGVVLPEGDVLDHELPFLNYRLGALKLGLDYQGRSADSVAGLLARAGRAILGQELPARLKLAHLAWFVGLGLAPRPVAARMMWLRVNRAAVEAGGRRLLGRLEGRLVRARADAG